MRCELSLASRDARWSGLCTDPAGDGQTSAPGRDIEGRLGSKMAAAARGTDGAARSASSSSADTAVTSERTPAKEGTEKCYCDDNTLWRACSIDGEKIQHVAKGSGRVPADDAASSGHARRRGLMRKQWTTDEEERFLVALDRFAPRDAGIAGPGSGSQRGSVRLGPGVAEMIAMVVGTRSAVQVRSHAQKHFIRKEREASRQRAGGTGCDDTSG